MAKMEYITAIINDTKLLRSVKVNPKTDSAKYQYTRNGKRYYLSGYIGYDEFNMPIFYANVKGKKHDDKRKV